MRVYLAGPISGLDYGSAVDWRVEAAAKLEAIGIKAYSPMRGKDFMSKESDLSFGRSDAPHPLNTTRGIMTRDYTDCIRADVLLINLAGAKTISAGTAMEMAWAYHKHIPVVVICEPEGNPHLSHPMIRETVDFSFPTLEGAIEMVASILLHRPRAV